MAIVSLSSRSLKTGTYESPSIRLPNNIPPISEFRAALDWSDLVNPDTFVKVDAYISDNNKDWMYFGGITYKGGVYDPQTQPGFRPWVDGLSLNRKYVKFIIETRTPLNLSAEVEF
uniref:Uncharacterized protein n=1 Tax=viral metagenome TaxID=1070528 RepID=A0A6M3IJC6_9ZZZZ